MIDQMDGMMGGCGAMCGGIIAGGVLLLIVLMLLIIWLFQKIRK